jgi:Putative transmembrane protein (PGPGW)
VTPGPGILLIIAGLAVLATEYVWAERLLNLAKHTAGQAQGHDHQEESKHASSEGPGSGG